MTPGQNEIFDCIFKKKSPSGKKRIWIATITQYGKSDTVAMAVLTRVVTFGERWCIVAPSQAKARIISGYLIKHIFDNEYTTDRFKLDEGESVDKIRRERSKNKMTFDLGDGRIGEVFILSAESRLKSGEDIGNAMMGFGCFDSGALVLTDRGEIPIGSLVKEKIACLVASFNENTGKVEWKSILSWQTNPRGQRKMFEVKTTKGGFICTEDHPIFIDKKGWVRAVDVKRYDNVLWIDKHNTVDYTQSDAYHRMSKLQEDVLQATVAHKTDGFQRVQFEVPRNDATGRVEPRMEDAKKLFGMRKKIQRKGEEVLRSIMYGIIQEKTQLGNDCMRKLWSRITSYKRKAWEKIFLQSFVFRGIQQQKNINVRESELERRDRKSSLPSAFQRQVEKTDKEKGQYEMPLMFREDNITDSSYRLRQGEQQYKQSDNSLRLMPRKDEFQQKNVAGAIVKSVSIVNYNNQEVFNIEVEDNHNYFVSGILIHNSPNVIMDEAALISDEADAKAIRMVGGFTPFGTDFVVKIGNPFTRGHFLKAYEDPEYHKINIDYQRALKEKRTTEKFIEEMRKKPFFRVLYENLFPLDNDIDSRGWTQLLSEQDIERAMVKNDEAFLHIGEKRLGNDVARGGENLTVWCLRSMNYAEIIAKSKQDNLTEIAGQTAFFMKDKGISSQNVFIDDVGVGGGAVDPLHYQQMKVRGVNVGQQALEQSRFTNIRAESYWRFREWIKKGGRLSKDDDWFQLAKIKYKPDSKGRLKIMSKDEMRAMGMDSPDVADAGMLTFVRAEHGDLEQRRKMRENKRQKHTFGRGLVVSMGGY